MLGADVELAGSMLEAVTGADAVVIVTEWGEFRQVCSAAVRDAMRTPLVVDGRNLLDPAQARAAGFAYESVGRPSDPGDLLRIAGDRRRRCSVIAVILVGGEGTRLRPLTHETPKAMLPIANRPFLEHQVEHLRRHGVDRIILACGYRPDAIRAHFGDALEYVVEPEPLGTGGAIAFAARGIERGVRGRKRRCADRPRPDGARRPASRPRRAHDAGPAPGGRPEPLRRGRHGARRRP